MGKNDLTLLSAFTGAGGLDLGLECAGFRTVGCIEFDETARATLQLTRPNWRQIEPAEINLAAESLTIDQIGLQAGELGMLAGGPPCQPFSKAAQWVAGGASGLRDERAGGLKGFMRLIEKLLPRVMLIENVPAFAIGKRSALTQLEQWLSAINRKSGTDYSIDFRLVNASDFGVPQRRQRAILIAHRDGRSFDWPTATHGDFPVRTWDAIGDVENVIVPQRAGRWADLLPSIPEGENYQWHTNRGGGIPLFGYRTRYWSFLLKLAKAEPSWTIAAQPGPSTGPFHWDNRPLSIEELLRLQTFPSSWPLVGSFREQVRQIGNATPPLLSEVIGRAIAVQFFGKRFRSSPMLEVKRRNDLPDSEPIGRVPKSFLVLRGTHKPHAGTGKGPAPTLVREMS